MAGRRRRLQGCTCFECPIRYALKTEKCILKLDAITLPCIAQRKSVCVYENIAETRKVQCIPTASLDMFSVCFSNVVYQMVHAVHASGYTFSFHLLRI